MQAGGAVFQSGCASSISFSIFTGNNAGTGTGGAVYRNACHGYTVNCSFLNNTAAMVRRLHCHICQADFLAQPFVRTGTARGVRCARSAGGACQCSYCDVPRCVGDACLQGGALYQNNCVSNNVRNSVLNGNKAQQGSAIYLNNSLPVGACT